MKAACCPFGGPHLGAAEWEDLQPGAWVRMEMEYANVAGGTFEVMALHEDSRGEPVVVLRREGVPRFGYSWAGLQRRRCGGIYVGGETGEGLGWYSPVKAYELVGIAPRQAVLL